MTFINQHFRVICIVLGTLILGFILHIATKTDPATATHDRSALPFHTCVSAVENAAKYDLRWTGWGRFSTDGVKLADGTIYFAGDKAEAQNGFGNWVRVRYTCIFDPKTKQADVSIERGRL